MKHKGWIICSGIIWAFLGMWLLYKGIHFIASGAFGQDLKHSWTSRLSGGPQGVVAVGVLIGFCKGHFVLSKTAKRICLRILSLKLPIQLRQVYSPSYAFLILGMRGLGMGLRFLPIPMDFRGMIDVAIGSALITGSMFYFRAAFALEAHTNSSK
ncbi:MAG: hypothetical protein IT584_00290 [Chlamydiae bacterium]|nr:hypothetical protein [Chlamydiota bacterium]